MDHLITCPWCSTECDVGTFADIFDRQLECPFCTCEFTIHNLRKGREAQEAAHDIPTVG